MIYRAIKDQEIIQKQIIYHRVSKQKVNKRVGRCDLVTIKVHYSKLR